MTQVEIGNLIEEALRREGIYQHGLWSYDYDDVSTENNGMDVRTEIEVKYLGTPSFGETFSLLHPYTLGTTDEISQKQKEEFIHSAQEKIRFIKSKIEA